ncbi:C2 domain-containing protein [Scenedesmus sp. NREL 46B-D3]|nr:C2 domain-containing protein [Scenedesmus sp. NREL 46B-D3]
MSTLDVRLDYADGIKDTQALGKQDPYCVVQVGPSSSRCRTCTDGGTKPVWNETLRFNGVDYANEAIITIKNENVMQTDDVIGTARVSLQRVKQVGSESLQVPVLSASGKQRGFLQISMTYHAQAGASAPYPGATRAIQLTPAHTLHSSSSSTARTRASSSSSLATLLLPQVTLACSSHRPIRRCRAQREHTCMHHSSSSRRRSHTGRRTHHSSSSSSSRRRSHMGRPTHHSSSRSSRCMERLHPTPLSSSSNLRRRILPATLALPAATLHSSSSSSSRMVPRPPTHPSNSSSSSAPRASPLAASPAAPSLLAALQEPQA